MGLYVAQGNLLRVVGRAAPVRGRIPAIAAAPPESQGPPERLVIVAARDEADRIAATLEALRRAFPGARLLVADDGSRDATASVAERAGAEVEGGGRRGKGEAATAAVEAALDKTAVPDTIVFCDGDLGSSAAQLTRLAEAVEDGRCDLAVASFARRQGGGFGLAVGFARRAIRSLTGLELEAPISGQRAVRGSLLGRLMPFASGFGMETGMTIDAARAGARISEIELDLEHRATGRDAAGFAHRGRQLIDFARAYASRRFRN